MNALMTIDVRIRSAQALAELRMLQLQSQKTGLGVRSIGQQAQWGLPALSKWGNQIQWAGRQLTYNFTMPIALAMGAASKFALENEKAMTRVTKVYGDNSKVFNRLAKTEIPALAQAFEALSNKYAVSQKDVINIGADWAAAGATGIALAKSVDLTLQTMILGEIGAADATQQLIAIQAQYGLSTAGLTKTIEILNMVENQTGASMKDLMTGLARAAGVARTAGVDVRHLAAMMAALVPATGTAASAGNGLRTIITRILSPTKQGIDVMQMMGIQVDKMAWQSKNATQRLEYMSKSFNHLSKAQQAHVASMIASNYQINRFVTLMRDVSNANGYYQKSLRSTSDEQKLFNQRQKELQRVMTSNPQMLKQTWVILQNAMARVIVPILPMLVSFAQSMAKLATSFSHMNPVVQKFIMLGLVLLAALGPIARYVGAVANMFGLLTQAAHWGGAKLQWFGKMALLPLKPITLLASGLGRLIVGFFTLGSRAIVVASAGMARFAAFAAARITLQGVITVMGGMILGVMRMGTVFGRILPVMLAGFSAFGRGVGIVFSRLPAIVGAATMGVQVVLARMRVVFATMITASQAAVGGAAVVWRTLPLLIAAVGLGVRQALTFMGAMMAALPAISARVVETTAMIWRTLPLLMAAVSNGVISVLVSMMLAMRTIMAVGFRGLVGVTGAGMRGLFSVFATGFRAIPTLLMRMGPFLLGAFRGIAVGLLRLVPMLFRVLTGPWGLAITAILGILYAFRDKVATAWKNILTFFRNAATSMPGFFKPIAAFFNNLAQQISNAFWALPVQVRNAMLAVMTVVRDAALKIYEWMSYLNPFVRHSPSLVESVKAGMDIVAAQYARAKNLGSVFRSAARDLAAFKNQASQSPTAQFASDRKQVVKAKGNTGLFDSMVGDLTRLYPIEKRQEAAVNAQQAVVDKWQSALDRANSALDRQQKKLSGLQDKLDKTQALYDAHKQAMEDFASAPIKGMGKMNEAIFQNQMAQKKLQLQMAQWEQANGPVDDVAKKIADLAGYIEKLNGQKNDLRAAGAGSEILGPLQDQINGLTDQQKALQKGIDSSPMAQWKKQLDDLAKQGDILQLQYDVTFDPMTHQIEQLVNAQKELSFDTIINGIKKEKAAMDALQPTLDKLNNAVDQQQKVVDKTSATRDKVQNKYDNENKKLQALQDAYQKTKDVISDLEGALRDMGQASQDAANKLDKAKKKGADKAPKLSNAQKLFKAGAGANWADPGTFKKIGRQGGMGDQSQQIKDFAEKTNRDMAKMFGSFDMFAPLKKKWNVVWGWLKENVGPVVQAVGDGITAAFHAIPNPFAGGKSNSLVKNATAIWDTIADVIRKAWGVIKAVVALFAPDFKRMWGAIRDAFMKAWNEIGPEVVKFKNIFKDIGPAFKGLWQLIQPVVAILGGAFLAVIKLIASVIGHTLGPILNFVVDTFKYLIRGIRGAVEIIVGILSGDWKLAWQGVKDIVSAVFGQIFNILNGALSIIWGIIKGLVGGIVGFFKWLYDVLVGHSIVPDLIDRIVAIFKTLVSLPKWVWNNVLKPVVDFFVSLAHDVKAGLEKWWSWITAAWGALKNLGTWMKNNVLKFVEDAFTWVWNRIKGSLSQWWAWITAAWNALRALGGWFKTNVLNPVFDKIRGLWTDQIKPEIAQWVDRFKNVWNGLTNLKDWFMNKVLNPIKDAFVNTWKGIRDWFDKNGGMIVKPIAVVINSVVDVINHMIDGLNAIANALPGIDWNIGHVGKIDLKNLAEGGPIPTRMANRGLITSGARAIIGEGKANYPEFVVPTDPTHRHRAQGLLTQAAKRLGMAAIPMHADGGILGALKGAAGKVGDWTKGGVDWMKGNLKKLASAAWSPFDGLIQAGIGKVKWNLGRQTLQSVYGQLKNVVTSLDDIFGKGAGKIQDQMGGGGGKIVPVSSPGDPAGHSIWKGGEFSNLFIAHLQKAQDIAGAAIDVIQGGWRPATSYSGTSHQGDAIDLQVNYSLIRALRQVGIAAGDRTGLGNWMPHVHAIPGPSAGYARGSAVWQWQDYVAKGGQGQALNSTWGLANGGIALARRGGVNAKLAEAGQDEAVIPLPRSWRTDAYQGSNSGGDTVININGNLEFPNIKSGEDADTLINNLKSLAGGAA